MQFKIVRSKFLEGLNSVQGIVAAKGSMPILQNVLLTANGNELTMITSDLEISVKVISSCDIQAPGSTTLPVKLLANAMMKVNEGEVTVDVDANDRATIKSGNAKFKISGMPENDFPRLPKDEESFSYEIPQQTLKEMLRKVAYAASQDDTRRTLKGVLMRFKDGKLTMVATDGRRLAMVENEMEFPQDAERDIVLPSKLVAALSRLLTGDGTLKMMVQQTLICFRLEGTTIYSKTIDENYPNYLQVIPSDTTEHISIDRQLLYDALERASVMTMDEAHSTRLIFESGRLVVNSVATDRGEAKDEVPIKFAGEPIEIIFNPSYLMECLRAIDDDEITINLNNGHSPAVIKCSIPFLYVLMPLRIS